MFYYIYNLKKCSEKLFIPNFDNNSNNSGSVSNLKFEIVDFSISEVISQIRNYNFSSQKEIEGTLNIKKEVQISDNVILKTSNIPFSIRTGSRLVFLETDKEIERSEASSCINEWLKNHAQLIEFIPRRDKVLSLVKDVGNLNSAKISTEKGIIDFEEFPNFENDKKGILIEYPIIEADVEFNIGEEIINMYYYGDAIQFPKITTKRQIEIAIQIFENVMFENNISESLKNKRKASELG